MMNRKSIPALFSLILALVFIPGHAIAGTMVLDSFVDQAADPISLPATKLLVATVNTSGAQGGNDASATSVSIGGTVAASDVAEVCVDYSTVEVICQANPNPLTGISLSLAGNQKGGAAFDYRVTLNSSAGGKTINLTVNSITNASLTDNIPLPQTTATVSVSGSASLPTLSTPLLIGGLSAVTSISATLGATQTDTGGTTVTARGIVWNTTGSPTTADTTVELQSGDLLNEAFSGTVSPLTAGTQIFFRGYATNSDGTGYTVSDGTVYTEPANQPTGISFSGITANSMTINWADPGGATGAEGAIVVMKEGSDPNAGDEVPIDGNDATSYSPSSAWGSAGGIGAGGAKVVFLGSGNTVNVTGLTTDLTYHVRIYEYAGTGTGDTGINYLEEVPLSGSETPTAGITQASNLWINNVGTTSMSMHWTEGPGDGSIVVMKQGSAVDSFPVDGTEHLADSAFGSGADLGGGNFVVYRGNGEFVHVTGLTQSLTYHMAVFTYTGAGALIEYLLPGPATANQTTAENTPHNVAVMNIDDTVTCTTGCHGFHGSAVIPRGADQETVCVSCHNPSGMVGALDKLNFSLHTNSKLSPPLTPGEVDCGSCHELHNPSGDNTIYSLNPDTLVWDYNLHYLRANPDKYIPGALSSDLVAHTDTNSEDWAFENGLAYQGPCQICHTLTPTGYQNTSAGDDTHQGGDLGNVNCRGCHDHGGSFAGAGGDCTACHNSIQDKDGAGGNPGRRIVTTEFSGGDIVSTHLTGTLDAADCEVCHDQASHQLGQVTLFDPDGGASIQLSSYATPTSDSVEAAKLTAFCEACHDSNGANGNTSPFTTAGTTFDVQSVSKTHTNGSVSCFGDGNFGCHGSGHGGEKLTLLAPSTGVPTPPDNTEEREGFCLACHDGGTPPGRDVLADLGGDYLVSVNKVQADSNAWVNQNHDILPADKDWNFANDGTTRPAITCADCHLTPHTAIAGSPVKDPDTGLTFPSSTYSPSNTYTDNGYSWSYRSGTGDQDPTNPEGGGTHDQTDYVEFCLTCHDGATPPGVTLSADLLDIASVYDQEYHGSAPNSGTGTDINRGGMKAPWTLDGDGKNEDPSAPYAALPCTICHGPHGSGNIFNLRTSINVAGTQMSTGSWGTGDEMDSIIGTTYLMPDTGAGQENRVWGAWCTFCHQLSAHSYGEDQVCRSGHQHGGSNF